MDWIKTGASRRAFLAGGGMALAGCAATPMAAGGGDPVAPYRTPYKYGKLVLGPSRVAGSFDEKAVDCPFVFTHQGKYHLMYVGFDGTGYQTGLAESDNLVDWKRTHLILPRDPDDPYTRYNIASASILRDTMLESPGRLLKVGGRYVCAWHAYPNPGYEEGAAVIGLAWSEDLIHWQRDKPILFPQNGADWERGGLYKPYLVKIGDTYHLYYNAKTAEKRWHEQTGVATSPDLKTWTRHPGNPILRNGGPDSPDARFASDPFVVQHRGQWAMYYFGLSNDGKARDLLALGDDPLHFDKVDEVLIDVGKPGSVDDRYAHKPALVFDRGDLYHFYCAVSGPWPNELRGISVARSRPW
ncbi:MAG TPA: hypothetical protein VM657_07965 [Sphingomonas sp.]|nr:hypothetical protein [Sphingomonas sp.]